MKLFSIARTSAVLAAFSILSACGGTSGPSLSTSNPNFFSSRVSEGTMLGAFNPAGFSAKEVRKVVAETCTGALGGFNTQPREDGLTAFSATCAAWRSGARAVEFERASGSVVIIEITGSKSGNLLYDRIETSV